MEIQLSPESRKGLDRILDAAAGEDTLADPHTLHVALNAFNRRRLQPATPSPEWETRLQEDLKLSAAEGRFLESERARIARCALAAPTNAEQFGDWFDALKESGPGQFDPLFDYLAEQATTDEMQWFIKQEVAGEAGFDDLVSLTQIRMPERPKLELARNYWDEMGRGRAPAMHGPMLTRLAEELGVSDAATSELVWESLALGNTLVGLAYNRRFAFHSVGALGSVELTAPTRAVRVVDGLDRLGIAKQAGAYFRLHSTVDVIHAQNWRNEVLIPLVEAHPHLAVPIAEGALMRLNAGARTFDRYRTEFGLTAPQAYVH